MCQKTPQHFWLQLGLISVDSAEAEVG